jgi:PIN domain-containing protein
LTFYFDRNFGTRFPEIIRRARPPFSVEYHHDPKNKFRFAQDTPDDVWLSKVAAEGWIVFSHDRKFHTLLPERSAIKQYSAGCFYLPGANRATWEKTRYFLRWFDGISNRASATAKPFIFELSAMGKFTKISIP